MNLDALDKSRHYSNTLRAIQTIPGNTAGEKHKWIGKSASHDTQDFTQLSLEAVSILLLEVAVKHKQYEDITLALRSKDWTIVNRALKATWFFDGSQEIIDAEYFSERVFPYISHYTKIRVVYTFIRCIKNPSFAQAIFNALTITYNFETALPLLMNCDQKFILETIVEKKFILPVRIFKQIYYKKPKLGVQLLKKYIKFYEVYRFCNRQRSLNTSAKIGPQTIIQEYKCILHTLAKKRSMEFVDIVQNVIQSVSMCSEIGVLSKKCAKKFLKKAKNAVIKCPYFYLPILPPELISAELLETMLPGLIKYYCRTKFLTDKILQYFIYLKDLPKDKKLEILFKTYRNLYQHEFLDQVQNLTPALLIMLPIDERIKFAEEMIKNNSLNNKKSYKTTWTCYLPAHEAVLIFKYLMGYAKKTQKSRLDLISKMIYTCKVNKDEDELYNVLSYIIDGEYVMSGYITLKDALETMRKIFKICEVPFVNERNGSLLCHMIRSFYIRYNYICRKSVMDMVHFRLIKNMNIADLIDMLIDVRKEDNYYFIKFNMFEYNAEYERRCLIFFIERTIKICIKWQHAIYEPTGQLNIQLNLKYSALYQLLVAIYNFNERWHNSRTKMERITIKNYPALMKTIESIINFTKGTRYRKKAMNMLRRHEPDLYHHWCTASWLKKLTPTEALRLLKNNYQSILNNWEEYLADCTKYYRDKNVQRFVRATRWYNDIPVNFVERCLINLRGQSIIGISSALVFLSLLLDGNLLTQLLDQSFLIKKIIIANASTTNTDINTYYNIAFSYSLSVMISNPPPFKLITKLGIIFGYQSTMKNVLSRVIQRFPIPDAMLYFTNNVSIMFVMERICWIQSICLITPINQQVRCLYEMWKTERHSLVQITLLEAILMLFRDDPCPKTALLLQQVIDKFPAENKDLLLPFEKFASNFDDHPYVWNFFNMWLEVIAIYSQMDYETEFIENCTVKCLCSFNPFFFESDKFDISNVFQKFLFHANYGIAKAMQDFLLPFLLCRDEILLSVINILFNALTDQSKFNAECSSAIRHNVYLFLKKFIVVYKVDWYSKYSALIENLLKIFTEESLIKQNLQSFSLLEYARIMDMFETRRVELSSGHSTEDSKEFFFGKELARRMPHLIEMFLPQSVNMMAKVLVEFLELFYEGKTYSRAIISIAKGLQMFSTNTHCYAMATMLLAEKH